MAIEEIRGKQMKPCLSKVEVIYPATTFGAEEDERLVLPCCLMAPHLGHKHCNSRLLLTCGGDRITQDAEGNDITGEWAPWVEERG